MDAKFKVQIPQGITGTTRVCAEIPEVDGPCYDAVKKFMVHSPCGLGSPCWEGRNEGCQAGFPFDFTSETVWQTPTAYTDAGPQTGGARSWWTGRRSTTGGSSPYNPYLLLRENCHVNVQVISSLKVLKYLFKYIHKGGDRAAVPEGGPQPQPNANAGGGGNGADGGNGAIGTNGGNCGNGGNGGNGANGGNGGNGAPAANGAEGNGAEQPPEIINEIERYQDMRYFGSCEAAWRLYGLRIHSQHPATMKLRIHLEDHQAVFFEEGDEEDVADREPPETHLTAWFALNAQAAENEEETPPAIVMMPRTYVWDQSRRVWRLKARGDNGTVGRLPFINPSAGEVFYLRTLLLHEQTRGARSFEEVRTVGGEVRATFRDACLALGLLRDDNQWHETMTTANEHMRPPDLRGLFVTILEFNSPSDPPRLLEAFRDAMTEDFARNMRHERERGQPDAVSAAHEAEMCRTLLLLDIEFRIQTPPLNRYGLEAVADGGLRDAALRFLERFARVVRRRVDGDARGGPRAAFAVTSVAGSVVCKIARPFRRSRR